MIIEFPKKGVILKKIVINWGQFLNSLKLENKRRTIGCKRINIFSSLSHATMEIEQKIKKI